MPAGERVSQRRVKTLFWFNNVLLCRQWVIAPRPVALRQWSRVIIDFYQSSDFSAGFRGTSLPKSSRSLKSPGVRIIRVLTRKRRTGYLFLTGENRSNISRTLSCWFCSSGCGCSCSCASDWNKDRNHFSSQRSAVIVRLWDCEIVSSSKLIRTLHFYKQLYWGKLRNILQLKVKIISARSVFSCHLSMMFSQLVSEFFK